MNFLDRAISFVSPAAALRRAGARAMLAAYEAAEKGRKNADWRTRVAASADIDIIEDAETINSRARDLARNSWVAKSALRARRRNTVRTGIVPNSLATKPDGSAWAEVRDAADAAFGEWAKTRRKVDVEGKKNFYGIQRRCVTERMTVGEHFVVWSYTEGVGLRLQSFEPEQLNLTIRSHRDDDGTVRDVRGGIEVDEYGAPVAYHFWKRPRNDYLGGGRGLLDPIRLPANRVFHYADLERALQTRGVSDFAPVVQRIRDFHRFDNAEMWTTIMQACLGVAITSLPGPGGFAPGLPPASGSTGTTASGMPQFDFTPGMVARLQPGEDVKMISPTRPGNTYGPYVDVNLQGIAAGVGHSKGDITRKSEGSYSAARQDMLTDVAEAEIEQDDLIELFIEPVWRLWFGFWVLEGHAAAYGLTPEMYAADPTRYAAAEFQTPAKPWIDPQAEANGYEKMLALRLTTRKEIIASQGGRWSRKLREIAQERDEADAVGIKFPEDAAVAPPTFAPPQN